MNLTHITYEIRDSIGIIQLNATRTLNAISLPMYDDILYVLEEAKQDKSVKAIILSAKGKVFCAGGDISEMKSNLDTFGHPQFNILANKAAQISRALLTLPKPVIAAVRNAVAGAAFNIVLSCDLLLAAENAKFTQAFIKLGLVPDAGGIYVLSKAVGTAKAKALALTGDVVTAEEGKALGFVYKTYPAEILDEEAFKLAKTMASGPSKAYGMIKDLIYQSRFADFDDYVNTEIAYQTALGYTADFKEGVTAFLEKRAPAFQGK